MSHVMTMGHELWLNVIRLFHGESQELKAESGNLPTKRDAGNPLYGPSGHKTAASPPLGKDAAWSFRT
jgi:hypothetical protein